MKRTNGAQLVERVAAPARDHLFLTRAHCTLIRSRER